MLPQFVAPDDIYEEVACSFDDEEILALTFAIVAVNGSNRFAVGLQSLVGDYASPLTPLAARDAIAG